MKRLVLLLFFVVFVNAQDDLKYLSELSISELLNVTVASKKYELITEAPGIVNVITKNQINKIPATNVGEILSSVAGSIFLSANVFSNNLISIRGQTTTPYNNHILILINGRPFRDPITGGLNNVIFNSIPIAIIEKIEIVRGPGSVLYGTNAFSGIINIITSRNDFSPEYSFETYYNSLKGFDGTVTIKSKKQKINYMLGIKYHTDNGEKFSFVDYLGVANSANFDKNYFSSFLNLNTQDLTFNIGYLTYNTYALAGANNNWDFDDPYDNNNHKHIFADAGYKYSINKKINLDLNLTYNHRIWTTDPDLDLVGFSLMPEILFNYKISDKHYLVLGGTYEYNKYWGEKLINDSYHTISFYSQFDYWITKNTKIITGIQLNKIENIKWRVSPRIGVIQKINDELGVKVLFSQAYRKGYPLETSFNVPVFQGNLELKPEIIDTYELQFYFQKENMRIALTGYYSKMSDIIFRNRFTDTLVQRGWYLKYINKGEHTFWGIETEFDYNPIGKVHLNGSVVFQENENDQNVFNATLHPQLYIKTGVSLTHRSFDISIFNSFYGMLNDVSNVNPDVKEINKNPENFDLLSVNVKVKLNKLFRFVKKQKLVFCIDVFNVFDKDIRYPEYTTRGVNSLIPLSSGISYQAGIKYIFN